MEDAERVWPGMEESLQYNFKYEKANARYRAPIELLTDEENKVIRERPCNTLNWVYYEV